MRKLIGILILKMMRMTSIRAFTGLGLLALVVVFLAGPRIEINTTIHSVTLPTDLENYVANSESAFDDITPGTEKIIIWAGETGVQTPWSVVYLHGFSASRQETAPLSDIVAALLGANLFYTRFTGHGRGGEAMLEGSVNAWLNDTVEAIAIGRRLGKRVLVIGMSTGGTAATWLATQALSDNVAAFVLISPNFSLADGRSQIMLWPWGRHLVEWFIGPERSWEPDNERHGRFWTHRYPTRALLPMMGMVNLVNLLDLSLINKPTLIIYSPGDQIISSGKIESVFEKIGTSNKRLVAFTNSDDPAQHVLAGDILSPSSTEVIARMIFDFVRQYQIYDSN